MYSFKIIRIEEDKYIFLPEQGSGVKPFTGSEKATRAKLKAEAVPEWDIMFMFEYIFTKQHNVAHFGICHRFMFSEFVDISDKKAC